MNINELKARKSELQLELKKLEGQIEELTLEEKRQSETPLTRESLIAWAQDRVDQVPSVMDISWDFDSQSQIQNIVPNSRERELLRLLKQIVHVEHRDFDNAYELIEEIVDLLTDGVEKPFSKMSQDELVARIFDEISGYDTMTVEELVSEFFDDNDDE